ncbi:hypothetical protein Scep_004096 [Stephania cephalantha]|uniref:Uncharacterized protein n=1 Tax=Stephania cephalantha TaxID=152367 RepID=A0AAP0PV17_9MAGN
MGQQVSETRGFLYKALQPILNSFGGNTICRVKIHQNGNILINSIKSVKERRSSGDKDPSSSKREKEKIGDYI